MDGWCALMSRRVVLIVVKMLATPVTTTTTIAILNVTFTTITAYVCACARCSCSLQGVREPLRQVHRRRAAVEVQLLRVSICLTGGPPSCCWCADDACITTAG